MNKKYHFPILKEKSTFVVQNAFFLLSTADNNFVTHFFLKKITNNNIHTLYRYRVSHIWNLEKANGWSLQLWALCSVDKDTSFLTRKFRVIPYRIPCIKIEIIKGHIYVSFGMYHKNDIANKGGATHTEKLLHCIFWQFQMIFLAKTTMFTLDCFGVGRIFFSMSCIFSIFLSRSCKRMTDVKIQNLLRDNRSILRKGLVLHTIAYIRDLHTYVYVKIFSSNRRSSSFDLKLLSSTKKKAFVPSFMFMLWYMEVLTTLYVKVFS